MERKDIENDLLEQLERNGVCGNQYLDLISDYMSLWDVKVGLIKDIKNRGVSVEYNNGGGQKGYKKNDSITELIKTNGQMLKILSELNLKAIKVEAEGNDEEM